MSSPRLSVATSQHCLTSVANWRRPRWTRDFMPDTRDAFQSGGIDLTATFEVGQYEGPPVVAGQRIDEGSDARSQLGQRRCLIVEPGVRADVLTAFGFGGDDFAASSGRAGSDR